MKRRWDQSVQSSNTPVYSNLGISKSDYGLYRCMVIKVLYVDDKFNITKNSQNPEVLYEVVILGGHDSGQTLSNCRLASWLGGNSNYSERILTATSKDISKIKLSEHDGDIVYVQFNQGHDAYPVIIALAKGLKNTVAAKASDGPRLLEEYNGLVRNINNKGELITTMKGGEVKDSKFMVGNSEIIKQEWLKDEKLVTTFKSGLVVTQDGKNDKFEIKTKGGLSSLFDGKNDKAEIKGAGGATVTIDSKSKKITIKASATEIIIDGNSGKITLKGEMIDLGASVADFVTQFTQLASAFATHTHLYSPGPGGPTPTSPPMAPLLTTVGSQTVKVQP